MIPDNVSRRRPTDQEPLFSRSVKAGKRVYYIDVKRDRRDEYYLAITESKRVQEGAPGQLPVFEKHKVFVYREDIVHVLAGLTEAAAYIAERTPLDPHPARGGGDPGEVFPEDHSENAS